MRRLALITAFLLALAAAVSRAPAETVYPFKLTNGSTLTLRDAVVLGDRGYALVYARENGTSAVIWNTPSDHGRIDLSSVRAAYESDGLVTALIYSGTGYADVTFVQARTDPSAGNPKAWVLEGISNPSGMVGKKSLRLPDHNHFEARDENGTVNSIVVDTKNNKATMDGRPLVTHTLTSGILDWPADAPVTAEEFFLHGKLAVAPNSPEQNESANVPKEQGHSVATPSSSLLEAKENRAATPPKTPEAMPAESESQKTPTWMLLGGVVVLIVIAFAILKRRT